MAIQNLKLYGQILGPDDSRLVIKNNGFVGIGLQNPTQKLHIDGNIIASGTITPDYVFENYFEEKTEWNVDTSPEILCFPSLLYIFFYIFWKVNQLAGLWYVGILEG